MRLPGGEPETANGYPQAFETAASFEGRESSEISEQSHFVDVSRGWPAKMRAEAVRRSATRAPPAACNPGGSRP